jgi:hypothetical protein
LTTHTTERLDRRIPSEEQKMILRIFCIRDAGRGMFAQPFLDCRRPAATWHEMESR